MELTDTLAKDVGVRPACYGLGIAHASYYRWKDKCVKPEKTYQPPLSLSSKERA